MIDQPLTPKAFYIKKKREWVENRDRLVELGLLSTNTTYISNKEMRDAHRHVLDTGEKALDALLEVSKVHNKGSSWVDDVKHSPVHKNVITNSLEANSKHPNTIAMRSMGILNRGSTRAIKSAKTTSSVLNTVADMIKLQQHVEALQEGCDDLQEVMSILSTQVGDNVSRLNSLDKSVANPKLRAYTMYKKEGLSITDIAKVMGKHRNTISRWVNAFNE